jgi:hypothetical protein
MRSIIDTLLSLMGGAEGDSAVAVLYAILLR